MASNSSLDHVAAYGQATLQKLDSLMAELDAFQAAYKKRLQGSTRLERRDLPDPIPGLHEVVVSVKGIRRSLVRILKARASGGHLQPPAHEVDDDLLGQEDRNSRDMQAIRGCDLAPHQEHWDVVKRTHGLLAFRRRFVGNTGKLGPTIEAVVQNGTEWIKVLTLTEAKLVRQMAQEGWNPDDSSDEEQDSDSDDDQDYANSVFKTVKHLVRAARANRCNTRCPRIRLVLPKMTRGRVAALDRVLDTICCIGKPTALEGNVEVLVDCADSAFLQAPIPPLQVAFANMFRDTNIDSLTSTLNLELTILLSLVSDITHAKVEPKEWHSRQTVLHIKDELHAPGARLEKTYSALQGHQLECTQEVAREVRNVVDDVGTETSKARLELLFGRKSLQDGFDSARTVTNNRDAINSRAEDEDSEASREDERRRLVSEFRKLSKYPVPDELQLPIQIVGQDEFNHRHYSSLIEAGRLPPVAAKVWEQLDRSYNKSCYLWGWIQDITTISGNNLNIRLIDAIVDQGRINPSEIGPRLYFNPLSISVNTARPCPSDKWEEIKDAKHERKDKRSQQAKDLKSAGTWGPSLGIPIKWDEKKRLNHDARRRRLAANDSGI